MKYIKFKEDHKTKIFLQGDVVKIEDAVLSTWLESGIVSKSNKKDYEDYMEAKETANNNKVIESKKASIEEKELENLIKEEEKGKE